MTDSASQLIAQDFGLVADLVKLHARQRPDALAFRDEQQSLTWAELDRRMDQVACGLQKAGLVVGDSIAICAASSVAYASVFLGALRAGVAVAPLAPGSTPASLRRMVEDAGARLLFTDASTRALLSEVPGEIARIGLDGSTEAGTVALADGLAPEGECPDSPQITPTTAFNIIYSSGTTGEPKGVVQGHGMRWAHIKRGAKYGYGPESVTLLSTPLYSNTTLVVFFPTVAFGGCVVLMPKFDAGRYLQLAQDLRVTHTMLVPVQYQRLMSHPQFDQFDLSSFQAKFCTSAPFSAALKADVLARWPGGLTEFYGMTEGGGSCILDAHLHPDKLHTVGKPAEGSDVRLIDEAGREVAAGESGEVVGHSAGMMVGYNKQPEKTREAEWFDAAGKRFIRTGDIARFDADGFLSLFDRRKDMIISGGFNIYPSDLESVLREHAAVADASVVGVPSAEWGETPAAFVVLKPGAAIETEALREWVNARVGKTQRITRLVFTDELPRSAIGKVLKRELRDRLTAASS
ncbi:class I adenylate-forming enzyme family protein [Variovorax dokdonensis]|uniref:Class I adenylate-forming enzyme family protein n=1 Tax=Variovorax dokdonensis TaxID=344883 RepID=A0ABT7NG01_9BURK|nr:class I adenylate-forming enzyme family protein [Variovorax dokdonensis]MDM0046890.1 class I adenylate-forming enzyme family protein [Variovorax dokdonensis]